jgi:hypothetical protein
MATVQAAGRQELVLVAEPVSVRRARGWLSWVAAGLVDESRRSDLELVMTEVVTNAVRHGSPGGRLLLAATPGVTREDRHTRVWFEFDY